MVHVMPGTHAGEQNRDLGFDGVNLVIRSDADPSQTIIDCEGVDRAFYLTRVHVTTTVIEGFRIVNGYGGVPHQSSGGAIAIGTGNGARTRDCVFTNNSATAADYLGGGAVHGNYDASIVSGCHWGRRPRHRLPGA